MWVSCPPSHPDMEIPDGNSEVPKSSPVVVQPGRSFYQRTSLPDKLSTENCSFLEPQEVTMHFNVMTYPDPGGYFIQ